MKKINHGKIFHVLIQSQSQILSTFRFPSLCLSFHFYSPSWNLSSQISHITARCGHEIPFFGVFQEIKSESCNLDSLYVVCQEKWVGVLARTNTQAQMSMAIDQEQQEQGISKVTKIIRNHQLSIPPNLRQSPRGTTNRHRLVSHKIQLRSDLLHNRRTLFKSWSTITF